MGYLELPRPVPRKDKGARKVDFRADGEYLSCPEHGPSSAFCPKALSLFSDSGEQLWTLSVRPACQMFADPRFFFPGGGPAASEISRGEGCASSQASPGQREQVWGGLGSGPGLRAVAAGRRA